MKAIVYTQYGPPEVLQVKEVAKPVPQDNEVLIKIAATAVTATDPVDRKGEPFIARLFSGVRGPKNPIPGMDLAGEIEAVGKDVKSFKKGDLVFGVTGLNLGAHAEYICLPEDSALVIKPANMTFEEAAGICDGTLTALHFLRDKAQVRPGQKVLINGASGSVGSAAVQLAKYYEAEVTGVCSGANVEMVKSLGADEVIDYTQVDFTKTGQTYNVIFDAVGKSAYSQSKRALTADGIYLTTVPTLAIVLNMFWTKLFGSKKAVFAAAGLRSADEKVRDLTLAKELVEEEKLKAVIDKRYPMADIADAHRYVETGRKKGNVVLVMG